jgi:predicted lipoprotein with Yx(FWY)xxD motif
MRRRLLAVLLFAALAALATVFVTASGARSHSSRRPGSTAAIVSVRHAKLGKILVDGSGRTLYLFEKDRHGRSACSGACAKGWPPLMTHGKPRAEHGAVPRLLGTTRRASGTQVTYAHHPLYRFAGDTRAGQTNGEGSKAFGAEWYVLATNGHKIDKS